ncbi:hypothetical protein Taro_044655, partial [Colocasia esculenta]|nr:hypothetical protein [Colocasia esculenta]
NGYNIRSNVELHIQWTDISRVESYQMNWPYSQISRIHMIRLIISNLTYHIISNEGTFTQILHIVSVPCHAPQVHTPVVNKYVGALFPRTGQGLYCTGIGQMDRSPILCRTNIFILWPRSFNDKLIVRKT